MSFSVGVSSLLKRAASFKSPTRQLSCASLPSLSAISDDETVAAPPPPGPSLHGISESPSCASEGLLPPLPEALQGDDKLLRKSPNQDFILAGNLQKVNLRGKVQTRYFVLKEDELAYYKKSAVGALELKGNISFGPGMTLEKRVHGGRLLCC